MAKIVKFDSEARAAMIRGVNILADTVMFGQFSGAEITVGEEKLLVMSEDEIVAVIKD